MGELEALLTPDMKSCLLLAVFFELYLPDFVIIISVPCLWNSSQSWLSSSCIRTPPSPSSVGREVEGRLLPFSVVSKLDSLSQFFSEFFESKASTENGNTSLHVIISIFLRLYYDPSQFIDWIKSHVTRNLPCARSSSDCRSPKPLLISTGAAGWVLRL